MAVWVDRPGAGLRFFVRLPWVAVVVLMVGCQSTGNSSSGNNAAVADAGTRDSGVRADGGLGADGGALGDAGEAQRVATQVLWALETTPGSHGAQPLLTVRLPNGAVLVVASVSGTFGVASRTVVVDEIPYVHTAVWVVNPDGTVPFLRHLADGVYPSAGAVMADGSVVLAGRMAVNAVVAPGAADQIVLNAPAGAAVVRLNATGTALGAATLGAGVIEPLVVSPAPNGEVWVGGQQSATFANGLVGADPDGGSVSRGFVATLSAQLAVSQVALLGGNAESAVRMLAPSGSGYVAVGDFGGYPPGAQTVFAPGTASEVSLAGVSSDDDPALDVFVARYVDPGALAFARRIRSYANNRRPVTWLGELAPSRFTFLLRDAAGLVEEGDQFAVTHELARADLCATFDAQGQYVGGIRAAQPLGPWPGGSGWLGASVEPAPTVLTLGEGTATLEVGVAATAGALNHAWVGSQWHADGRLQRAGALEMRVPEGANPLTMTRAVAQADGSFLVVLSGEAEVTLLPAAGNPVTLPQSVGYERFVFVRVLLADAP